MPNLYLIDGHATVFKYYFGYLKNPLTNSAGENTSAAYGIAKMILMLLKTHPVTHIGVIFDPPHGSFRKKIYPEYKATREKKPEIAPLLANTYRMLKEWGIYTSAFEGYEADDAIGTFATRAAAEGFKVNIVTRDKDFMQLVGDNVNLIDLGSKIGEDDITILDAAAVKEKFGVYPNQVRDVLALAGDTSDNIPGVVGIGPKTAATLLDKYGSIDSIYSNLDKLTKSQKSKFEAAREHIPLYKQLVTIVCDMQIQTTLDQMKKPEKYSDDFIKYLEYLELASIIKDL